MYPMSVVFNRFEDVSFGDVLRGTGVYVIWDSQARAKPSYIGKGDILSRLASHADNFAFPVRGYIALVGNCRQKTENKDASILEALLLEVARHTDRWPLHNKKSGGISLLRKVYEQDGVVRVTLKGFDPFGPPHAPRSLEEPKQMWFKLDHRDGAEVIEHQWNYRKRITR